MSDSDDTDVLLLIPPDFFFVAPSPSPASSPSLVSPPSPIPPSTCKQQKALTEKLARKSLQDITSKLKIIDKRLSLIENQRSEAMDRDHSCTWFDLESNTSGSTRSRPHETMEKPSDWRSMRVQELIQASVRDPNSAQRRDSPMTQSWGSSYKEHQFSPSHRSRSSSARRDYIPVTRVAQRGKEFSSDEEREWCKEKRASSLPPTPSSHHPYKKIDDGSRPMHKPIRSYERNSSETASKGGSSIRRSSELEGSSTRKGGMEGIGGILPSPFSEDDGRHGRVGSGTRGWQQSSGKDGEKRRSSYPEGVREWVNPRSGGGEKKGWEQESSFAAEGGESFDADLSNLDGTLGVSGILPSLSSLGLGTSVLQESLEGTKESNTSLGRGLCGGLSLSEVEKLLEDMHRTQVELERSMRRGKVHVGKGSGYKGDGIGLRGEVAVGGADGNIDIGIGDQDGKSEIAGLEKRDMGVCKEGVVREEVRKREEWIIEGKNQKNPMEDTKVSPIKIVVGGTTKNSLSQGENSNIIQEVSLEEPSKRGPTESLSARDDSNIYRSKSDESLTGGRGKSSRDAGGGKYLGVDLGDDSFLSNVPVTSKRFTRLGDTLGSVPDLGLGVREMFARPETKREVVREPPFVKKHMTMLGSALVDAVEVSEEDIMDRAKSFGNLSIAERVLDDPPKSVKDGINRTKPVGHKREEGSGFSQTNSQGSNSGANLSGNHLQHEANEKPLFCVTPQKYLYTPQSSSQENRENSSRDAQRQLHFVEEIKNVKQDSSAPVQGIARASMRPPVRDGGEELSKKQVGKGSEDATSGTDRWFHGIPNSMGPVMVVGGDGGKRKKRRLEGGNDIRWVGWPGGDGTGRSNRGAGLRNGSEYRGGDRWWRRDKWTMPNSGHRSLDDHLGRPIGGRFKDTGLHGSEPRDPQSDPRFSFLAGPSMWGPPLTPSEEVIGLRRKLEEERFRREHCERVIEEVGRRALEAQERLAVSQGLSKAKDVALGKFREAWEEAVSGWKREGEARIAIEEEVDRFRGRVDAEITYRDQHLKQLEEELVRLGAEASSLREELRKGQRETADTTSRLSGLLEAATKEVTTCRKEAEGASLREARAQDAASKAEDTAKEAMKKLEDTTKKAEVIESEKNMLKQELETLQGKLRDSISRVSTLESRLADAEIAADRASQKEKKACDDLLLAQQELGKERVKLKEFYQSQVEELVKSKVNEFQGQLDAIELSLRKEADVREEQARKQGEERLRLLGQKNSQEVSLLEQKHEEELALWSLRLKRVMAEAENLRSQVSRHNAQKAQLAKGLHALMQTQLKQGLRLIASGGENAEHDSMPSPLKRAEKKLTPLETSWRDVMTSLNFSESTDFVPEKDLIPKKDTDKDLGYSSMVKDKTEKDVISSSNRSASSVPNSELKKYIHMLLDRVPGKPVNWMGVSSDSEEDAENQKMGLKQKDQVGPKDMNRLIGVTESEKVGSKERKGSKRLKQKEGEGSSKQSSVAPPKGIWEPLAFKLNEPAPAGQMFEVEANELDVRRYRKPPWK